MALDDATPGAPDGVTPRRHILTVSVEEYFHSLDMADAVAPRHWERMGSRVAANVDEVLALLARHGATATFFVTGWTAERQPRVVARIAAAGHEVASSGYWPVRAPSLTPDEFRADLARARRAIEAASGQPVVGHRATRWLREDELWMLDVLIEEGYRYDSSINPMLADNDSPHATEVHLHRHPTRGLALWELPISTVEALGLRVPIAGGNYVRQLPPQAIDHAIAWWDRHKGAPLVFYFMSWELDPDQPRIGSMSTVNRIRHYRNLERARASLERYLGRYAFRSAGDFLELPRALGAAYADDGARASRPSIELLAAAGEPVTVVVPVYNEEASIAFLRSNLLDLRRRLAGRWRTHFTVVDDGSRDGTWAEVQRRFAGVADFTALRHPTNRGIAAAILTGIRAAPTELVCSIDCDCSYDPGILEEMLPRIASADLVTASPYHPQGRVVNVPGWRLVLSKSLSRMYSALLDERFHTFTSCCRVYRRSLVARLDLRHDDFLGIAELLIEAKRAGARVVEHPATLESRMFGVSKMKTARTIGRHLRLLSNLAARRALGEAGGLLALPRPDAASSA